MIPTPSPLLAGYELIRYQQPTIQLQISNATAEAMPAYIGGAVMHPESTTEAGQLFTNPNFAQGATGWVAAAGWVIGIGASTYTIPAIPDNSGSIGQLLTGLTVGRLYTVRIRISFSAPTTGVLLVSPSGTVPLVGVVGIQTYEVQTAPILPTQFFGIDVNTIAPTLVGTVITLLGIDVLDSDNPEVQYYRMVQNGFTSRPVRMSNTRFIFSNPTIQASLPVYYAREDVTGHKETEYIPLDLYRNPYYLPAYGIIDIRKALYTLDGQNFLQLILPPASTLIWCADVQSEARAIQ